MTKDAVLAILRKDNPGARAVDLSMYADAYLSYREAQDNIDKCGAIAAHPRTGQPIENPYLRVRESASKSLANLQRVKKTDRLWQ